MLGVVQRDKYAAALLCQFVDVLLGSSSACPLLFIYLFIYFVATIPYNMAEAKGAILGTESMKDGDEVGKRQTYEYNATLVKIKAHNKIIHKVHTYHSSSIAALVESGMIVRVSGISRFFSSRLNAATVRSANSAGNKLY